MNNPTICKVYRFGTIEFQKAWNLQNQLAEKIGRGEHPPSLLLLEHAHTFTFGRRGNPENLLWDKATQAQMGVDIHWIDRGGDVTYHGPGQLVGYPLLPLRNEGMLIDPETNSPRLPTPDYIGYLRNLEKVLIKTLAGFGIVSGQIKGQTGVWVQPEVLSRCIHCPPALYKAPAKIASIGVKVDARGVSRHGFALNVDPDMRYWDGIRACDLENQNQASMAYLLDSAPAMDTVATAVISNFAKIFSMEMQAEEGIPLR